MALEITVPVLGESVSEATVAKWLKKVGDSVAMDEPLLELETDKVTLEVNATSAGTLAEIVAEEGATVEVGALLGTLSDGAGAPAAKPAESKPEAKAEPAPAPAPAAPAAPAAEQHDTLSPAVRKLIDDNKLKASDIQATGKDGRLTKEDVLRYLESRPTQMPAAPAPAPAAKPAPKPAVPAGPRARAEQEERVRMTRLRQRIAERLKEAQDTAAMLTTFNEVDMTNLLAVRNSYKDVFEKKHGVKLGFMSFFVKACITALQELPAVNAEIEGTDIIYKNYYDIGVAVGTPSGLVVPVVRDADKLNFAGVEKTIGALGKKARDGKLSMEELSGGTFTISNGGVYGSLMSTPIINPPQSAILGMHKTQERPMVVNGKIEIRPMMYLALSYDHRIIDGKEAVTFLVRVKECIEDPQRILLDV
ncbi:2-oxoglutarate dehydrogenase complex dihydrolipoyllysine-residue succinyltransferase [Skermanella sp. TT6]|uniref:Dihydrolipoyllysine-residue succinyltransferase component of 2-oxoglutarate dehydrogenase complex n=1 Tax=Skermanella cutis TaxID=2775420 RepID=A0ABX7B462_9PROT|nr:2-oxoglutarate dehydrogenase complex dihydrolipoyllysine-residue succinyltransferase [Skermanella sp. TT6]QQP88947.1 2-oxoglutarate dehydrogenase complex dihydrolipoyllysine-residue succinyltransferase [Skermanella sp. TT6]